MADDQYRTHDNTEPAIHQAPPAPPPRRESPWMRHRTWAREQDILTERGWQEGYVVFKPSRWMTRFFFDAVLPLNTALNRLEANSFTLLGTSQSFSVHARDFSQQLADFRASARRLARQAERLARGRLPTAEPEAPVETATPSATEELGALQGPTLAETRAPAAQDGR